MIQYNQQLEALRAEALGIIQSEPDNWPDTDITILADIDAAVAELLQQGRLIAAFVIVVRITQVQSGLLAPTLGGLETWTVTNQLPEIGQVVATDYWTGEIENIA